MLDNQGLTCRGSIALGTACRKCSKCKAELDALALHNLDLMQNPPDIVTRVREKIAEFRSKSTLPPKFIYLGYKACAELSIACDVRFRSSVSYVRFDGLDMIPVSVQEHIGVGP
jgi:hypothetical protein